MAHVDSSARWLFSGVVDVAAFVGSTLTAGAVVLIGTALGVTGDAPPWVWLVFVLGIDVAHVWATLFRVYLDAAEVRRRPVLYGAAPVAAYVVGVAAHHASPDVFWRLLAYVAVWHFIRQQMGFMALYGRRAGHDDATRRFDATAVLAATLGPVVWWHANLPRPFAWFRDGDFVGPLPSWLGTFALALHAVVLLAWLTQSLRPGRWHPGKAALLVATWLAWFGGIVLARSDFAFTVMNVVLHGVGYLVRTRRYQRARLDEGGYGRWASALRGGLPVFLGLLWALAFFEEWAWDALVWHEHPMFFGEAGVDLAPVALTLVVPLLSLPQTTHYVLDGFIWKTRDDEALAGRLGWAPRG